MSLTPHVQVTLTINNAGVALAGFGLIACLSYTTLFPERIRLYSRTSSMVTDGFAADGPEVLFANRVLSQSPHPTFIAIVRGDLAPTQRYELNATVRNSFAYKVKVKGEGVTATTATFTSDASATRAEIHFGIVAALNAVTGKNFTAAFKAATAAAGTFTAVNATETFTKNAHGFQTGDGPYQLTNSGGALPGGTATLTDYYIIRDSANDFKLATTRALALAGTNILISTDGTGVHTITPNNATSPSLPMVVTGDAAGEWFSLEVLDRTALSNKQTHADPGIATDLAAIQMADSSWYYLYTTFNSEDCLLAAAAWVEANGKVAYLDSCNTETENTAAGNGDEWDQEEDLGYKRTVAMYHSAPDQMFGAGLMGVLAPYNPGRWTAAYKEVSGVSYMSFTDTQIANLDARKVTYYKREAGRSISWEGKVANTSFGFIDVTTSLDWFLDTLQKRSYGVLVSKPKLAYTDEDIAQLRAAAEGVVALGVSDAYTVIAPGTPGSLTDPEPTVSFPRVADIDPSVRALRKLPDGNISFRLASAVHSVIFDVTVSF